MHFADLHAHFTLKLMVSGHQLERDAWYTFKANDNIAEGAFDSQFNLTQVAQTAGWKLICCALHPPEKQVITYCGFHLIAAATPAEFDLQWLRGLAHATPTYHDLLMLEAARLDASLAHPPAGMEAPRHIGDMGVYASGDTRTYVFFTVEGAHAFCTDTDGAEDMDQVLDRLTAFRQDHQLGAVNLCHFQQHRLATQAYAFIYKTFKPKADRLFPTGTGITADGHRFIRKCHELGVAVDLKHMGWGARKEFYEQYPGVRLLASHVGVNGLSWKNDVHFGIIKCRKDGPGRVRIHYRKPPGELPDTLFDPCSLNLYDEDIHTIIASDGIIGLSMDQRILGAGEPLLSFDHVKKHDREFISEEDHQRYFLAKIDPAEEMADEEIDEGSEPDAATVSAAVRAKAQQLGGDDRVRHARYLVSNILHIVKVGQGIPGRDPWEHIAIGSDFDGLVNPVDFCTTARDMGQYAQYLGTQLNDPLVRAAFPHPYVTADVLEQICFRNAERYMHAAHPPGSGAINMRMSTS